LSSQLYQASEIISTIIATIARLFWAQALRPYAFSITAIFSASKPQIPVGAKHDRRQIIAENIVRAKHSVGANGHSPLYGRMAIRPCTGEWPFAPTAENIK